MTVPSSADPTERYSIPTRPVAEAAELAHWLRDARARTLEVASGLNDAQLMGPQISVVNPIRWALGHIAFFQERWAWCHQAGQAPLWPDAALFYDSFEVEHAARWSLPLPDMDRTRAYLDQVLEHVLARLAEAEPSRLSTYFHRLTVLHEDMHAEAITYDRHTLSYPAPPSYAPHGLAPEGALDDPSGAPWPGDVEIPGSSAFPLGADPGQPFVWDNEKWAHPVQVHPFRIARAPVTCGEFADFVEAGGYRQERWWSAAAWRWLKTSGLEHPNLWRRATGGGWQVRHFDQWAPFPAHHPVTAISWHEAQAYCAWTHRRLPTEAEWELAASTAPLTLNGAGSPPHKSRFPWGDAAPTRALANLDSRRVGTLPVNALPAGDSGWGCRQMLGNVWEWTEDAFYPYPGFVPDPYREYSAPWFGYHKVLKGGAWTTRSRLVHTGWRNFYLPTRMNFFSGFRTCAR
jgi:iron(II)-dependent oxidoreductase